MGMVLMTSSREPFELYDEVLVRVGCCRSRYVGTIVKIIYDHKNLKTLLVLEGVPSGRPCKVDSSDCTLLKRALS